MSENEKFTMCRKCQDALVVAYAESHEKLALLRQLGVSEWDRMASEQYLSELLTPWLVETKDKYYRVMDVPALNVTWLRGLLKARKELEAHPWWHQSEIINYMYLLDKKTDPQKPTEVYFVFGRLKFNGYVWDVLVPVTPIE